MAITTHQPSPCNMGRIRAATVFMLRLALGGLCVLHCDAQAASTATLIGNCQSVVFNPVVGIFVGNPGTLFYSTFDGRTDVQPLRQSVGGAFLYSGEFRRRSAGVYETDYSTIKSSDGGYITYGSVVLNLSSVDSDGIGIPDFAQRDKLGTLSVTGTYTRDWPTAATVAITGSLTRSAGSTMGAYSIVDQATGGSVANIDGTMEVQTYTGSFAYTRGAQNTATLTMSRTTAGATFNLAGNTPFTVTSANQISLPQFQMTNSVDASVYSVLATTFARTGNKFVGSLRFADGDMRTSWADNTDWVFVITDPNDADANGIPDLSDSLPAAPSITTQPQNQTVTAGANVTFTVAASGTAPLTYQWQHAGTNLPSQTASTLTLNSVTAVWAGAYAVEVSNVGGTTTSATATLTVNSPAPVIASSATATATVGSAFSYTITANNSPTSYGATGLPAGLSVNPASGVISGTPTVAGGFTVNLSASNAGGTGTRTLTLTINTPPSITTPPQGQTVAAGGSVTFSVVAAGTAPLSYQWRKDGTNLNGSTGSSYTIASVQASHAGSYAVVVSNVAGSVTSAPPAVLVVNGPPSITTQPQSQTVTVGASVSFTVAATGTAPLNYQWRKLGSPITGAISATLVFNSVQLADAGTYDVMVTNLSGSATSSVVTLVVTTNSTGLVQAQYVEIGTLPVPTASERAEVFDAATQTWFSFPYYNSGDLTTVFTARPGSNELFAWTQTTSFPSRTTYWGRGASDGTNLYFTGNIDGVSKYAGIAANGLLGTWQSMPALPNPAGPSGRSLHSAFVFRGKLYILGGWHGDGLPAYADAYYAPIQNGGAVGSFVQTTSLPTGVVSAATTVSTDGMVYVVNNTNLFSAQIANDGSIGSWTTEPPILGLHYGNNGGNAAALSGNLLVIVNPADTLICRLNSSGHLDSLVATIANPGNLGQRSVYANNGRVYVTATTGKIYRIDVPLAILTQPQSQTVTVGANLSFTVAATSLAPLSYQWLKDGVLIAGQTNAQLNLSSLTNRARGGSFSVMVSNLYGAITGNIGSIRVRVPHRLQPPVATNGMFRLLSADQDGGLLTTNDLAFFTFQTSTNLTPTNWLSFTFTNGLSLTNGMLRFDDTNAATRPFRYYRVIEQ